MTSARTAAAALAIVTAGLSAVVHPQTANSGATPPKPGEGGRPVLTFAVDALPDTIHLDAIVTDRQERPIRDLKPSDFELTDNGGSRSIDEATLESGRDGRLIAIFLDEYHVQPGDNTMRAREALSRFVNSELRPNDVVAVMKPLDSVKAIPMTVDRDGLRAAIEGFEGRKGDYAPRTPFEQAFISRAPASADASRAQVVSSALQALALRIGGTRAGRKTIVLVTEGFAPSLPRGSDRLTGSLRAVIYAANRYGVAIYPIDPRPSADPGPENPLSASLRTLADETGGEASLNHADLTAGLTQAVRDLDEYYELTYRAAGAGDGKFHAVQLRVKRPDAQVRMRSGYWSASPEMLRLASGAVPQTTMFATRPPHASPLIRPWLGASRGSDGLTNVQVTWDPGIAPPRNQHVSSVVLKATTDAGRVLFQGTIGSQASFEAPPGHIQLEMTIRGDDGKTLDSDYRGMDVPNLQGSRLTIATPQIVRTRSAREFAAQSVSLDIAPVASREFSRSERLLVRVPVYAGSDRISSVTATLLNPVGTPMRELTQVPGSLPEGLIQFDLLLSSLAPDSYRIEIAATSTTGQLVKTAIPFRVTN